MCQNVSNPADSARQEEPGDWEAILSDLKRLRGKSLPPDTYARMMQLAVGSFCASTARLADQLEALGRALAQTPTPPDDTRDV